MMVGAIAQSDSMVEKCMAQPRPPGATIRPMMHAHNPTVLPDLVFVGWLGHGVARSIFRILSTHARSGTQDRSRGATS